VKDLIFIDGNVRIQTCDKLVDKRNSYLEYALLKQALRPYAKDIATAITEEVYIECDQKYKNIRSKQFYNDYQASTKTNIPILSKFLIKNCDDNIVFNDDIYIKRVCYEKEKKSCRNSILNYCMVFYPVEKI
jgi:hypothetical protein